MKPLDTQPPETRQLMADLLLQQFPWLATDEEASGADTIDELNTLYGLLGGRRLDDPAEWGQKMNFAFPNKQAVVDYGDYAGDEDWYCGEVEVQSGPGVIAGTYFVPKGMDIEQAAEAITDVLLTRGMTVLDDWNEDEKGDEMCDYCFTSGLTEVAGTVHGKTICNDCMETHAEDCDICKKQKDQTVTCSACHQLTPAATAHLHQGEWIGDECWDEKLRSSE